MIDRFAKKKEAPQLKSNKHNVLLFVTSIHQSAIFFIKYLFIYCFFWIEFIRSFLNLEWAEKNAFHSIIKIIITPNFAKKIFVDW